MIRLALLLAVLLLVFGAAGRVYLDARRDARDALETDRRIEDARDRCPDDLEWLDRLHCARPR